MPPLGRARTAASSPRNDLVKNCRVHPTHRLISTQVPALWDQIPEGAKWQIITAIGCLEWYDEWQYDNPAAQMPAMADKPKHYMRGGQPGIYRVEINRRGHGEVASMA